MPLTVHVASITTPGRVAWLAEVARCELEAFGDVSIVSSRGMVDLQLDLRAIEQNAGTAKCMIAVTVTPQGRPPSFLTGEGSASGKRGSESETSRDCVQALLTGLLEGRVRPLLAVSANAPAASPLPTVLAPQPTP